MFLASSISRALLKHNYDSKLLASSQACRSINYSHDLIEEKRRRVLFYRSFFLFLFSFLSCIGVYLFKFFFSFADLLLFSWLWDNNAFHERICQIIISLSWLIWNEKMICSAIFGQSINKFVNIKGTRNFKQDKSIIQVSSIKILPVIWNCNPF